MAKNVESDEEGQKPGRASRLAFDAGDDLANRIKNFVFYTPGASIQQFLIEAATKEIERLEHELNKGKRWPQRTGRLRPGRPMSS